MSWRLGEVAAWSRLLLGRGCRRPALALLAVILPAKTLRIIVRRLDTFSGCFVAQ
jgi:hypothetical protein